MDTEKLDNPVWYSLKETHQKYALDYDNVKCYHPDFCPFGGYEGSSRISVQIDAYSKIADDFYISGDKPEFPGTLTLKKELVCLQMVMEHELDVKIREDIVTLNNVYEEELYTLVNLVQPGYFRQRTARLGDYHGIFKNGRLVAVTGERMKMNDFTEVSAVVTDPGHTGKGYAKQLIAHTVNKIRSQNKTPYLHVAGSNAVAIALYGNLGFRFRRKISYWNFVR